MRPADVLVLLALAASVLLVLKVPARAFPIVALVGSALEALRSFGILNVKVPVVGAALLFAAAMIIGGAGAWAKSTNKLPVTAATLVVLVGLIRAVPGILRLT
jgi:hypothetical protein